MPDLSLTQVFATLFYGALGFIMFLLSLWIMERLTPFSIEKKITEENNVALGIVIGAVVISLGLIYAAVVS
ncbi:MAG: DUF350 domain-containing protein [Gammaproteobacteria bacterium]|nr:MAG: DUF350 domain-containing protein [Gammaproteobacteria bacterium]